MNKTKTKKVVVKGKNKSLPAALPCDVWYG